MIDQPEFIMQVDMNIVAEAIRSNDDLGILIRAHLEIERAMIRVLEQKFPNYGALKHDSFGQHIKALRSLGATGAIFQCADQINKIRNEMAHVKKGVRTEITEKDIKELCSQASGAFGGCADVLSFTGTLGDEGPKSLREFPRAKQLLVIAIMTAAAIDTIPQREQVMAAEMQK